MCTAVAYTNGDFYFGRTLDYEYSYHEEVTICPRNFPFKFRHLPTVESHYAIIGMAYVLGGYPLYYDAANEKGLAMAGLNFVGNARYKDIEAGRENVASFEFIPYILSQCADISEAGELLKSINITNTPFSEEMPPSQLHFIISDKSGSITVESVEDGLIIYENPVGVLTNNPTFDKQMFNLNNYMGLSAKQPKNNFSQELDLKHYSRGMGAMGLPGDLSSQSRFVRAAFTKMNSVAAKNQQESVSQFFHIMSGVAQARGCCELENGEYEITIYTSCCDCDRGIYYYTTYTNRQINAVNMYAAELDGDKLSSFPLIKGEHINMQN